MTCKYFYEDTDVCGLSASEHFRVWFVDSPDKFRGLEDVGIDNREYRSVGSCIKGQHDVCPIQGESDGINTGCPFYKEK